MGRGPTGTRGAPARRKLGQARAKAAKERKGFAPAAIRPPNASRAVCRCGETG